MCGVPAAAVPLWQDYCTPKPYLQVSARPVVPTTGPGCPLNGGSTGRILSRDPFPGGCAIEFRVRNPDNHRLARL
jgi:hypothetical protein